MMVSVCVLDIAGLVIATFRLVIVAAGNEPDAATLTPEWVSVRVDS